MKKYLIYITSVSALLMLLSACGFHLRGKIELPTQMSKVFIQSKNLRLAGQLGRALKTSGALIVKDLNNATAILKIYSVSSGKSVRSVGGTGRVREFSLVLSVNFGIKGVSGEVFMKRQTAKLVRDYSFNETQVVGKSVEESIIRDEMRRQMISTLLRRIQRNFKAKQKTKILSGK